MPTDYSLFLDALAGLGILAACVVIWLWRKERRRRAIEQRDKLNMTIAREQRQVNWQEQMRSNSDAQCRKQAQANQARDAAWRRDRVKQR